MRYLDSNVFIHAALNLGPVGERARSLLKRVQQGSEEAASSALTFDEIVWNVGRYRTYEDGVAAGEAFLNMSGLKLWPVEGEVLASSLALMKKYHLAPRDAIHAASALLARAEEIISTDEHFDPLAAHGLRRKAL